MVSLQSNKTLSFQRTAVFVTGATRDLGKGTAVGLGGPLWFGGGGVLLQVALKSSKNEDNGLYN